MTEPRPYCKPHSSHFCPCCKPELYNPTDKQDAEYIRGWEKIAPIVPISSSGGAGPPPPPPPTAVATGPEPEWCPACGGRGSIGGSPCSSCGGSGYLKVDRQDEVEQVMEEAIKKADRPPSDEWKEHAHEVIRKTAMRLPELTSEDVWESGLMPPDNGSPDGDALGPAMRRARLAGFFVPTGRTTTATNRPQRHKNPKRVWRSLIYKESYEQGEL